MRELMTKDMIKHMLPESSRYSGLVESWGWLGTSRPKGTPRADFIPVSYKEYVTSLDFSDLSDEEFLDKYIVFMFFRGKMR